MCIRDSDYTVSDGSVYFLPREQEGAAYLNTGYVSEEVADEEGIFSENPTVTISLEAAYKCFGLTMVFDANWPAEVVLHAYNGDESVEDYTVSKLDQQTLINHEFPEFDRLLIEFTKGCPNNRVVLDRVIFGDSTDYYLEYGTELLKSCLLYTSGSGTDLQFSGQGQDNSDCGTETGTDNRDSAVPRRHCAGYAVS